MFAAKGKGTVLHVNYIKFFYRGETSMQFIQAQV